MKKVIVCLAFFCLLTGTAVVKPTRKVSSSSLDELSRFESKVDSFNLAIKQLEYATEKLDKAVN